MAPAADGHQGDVAFLELRLRLIERQLSVLALSVVHDVIAGAQGHELLDELVLLVRINHRLQL